MFCVVCKHMAAPSARFQRFLHTPPVLYSRKYVWCVCHFRRATTNIWCATISFYYSSLRSCIFSGFTNACFDFPITVVTTRTTGYIRDSCALGGTVFLTWIMIVTMMHCHNSQIPFQRLTNLEEDTSRCTSYDYVKRHCVPSGMSVRRSSLNPEETTRIGKGGETCRF